MTWIKTMFGSVIGCVTPSCEGGGRGHCCRWLGSFSFFSYTAVHQLSEVACQANTDEW